MIVSAGAAKRLLKGLRSNHPNLRMIVAEDVLYANAPHLKEFNMRNTYYIIEIKPGDLCYLFDHIDKLTAAGQTTNFEVAEDKYTHRFKFINQVPLNAANPFWVSQCVEQWFFCIKALPLAAK